MPAVQEYETDALQEHTDSTPVLVARLEQWSRAVNCVYEYANGLLQAHTGLSHDLDKTGKHVAQGLPQFPDRTGQAGDNTSDASLGSVFVNLQTQTAQMLQKNNQTVQGIRSNVLQPLENLIGEVEKHFKTLRNQGGKGIKDIEKSRELTQKLVENLGKVTSIYGTRDIDASNDPYVLSRKVKAAIYEQVGIENTQAEAALSVQKTFASLEAHILEVLRQSVSNLQQLTTDFDNAESDAGKSITTEFNGVDVRKEWAYFAESNKENLVPEDNYQRNPNKVRFNNMDHPSIQPLIEGVLQRRSTTLKQYHQGFFVVTPTGYLFQFKSGGAHEDPSPELSLFLPDCQLSSNPADLTFKVAGKDSKKMLATRHKYTFKTASPSELDQWYAAIARITGAAPAEDLSAVPSQATSTSPNPPTEEFRNASLDQASPTTDGSTPTSPVAEGSLTGTMGTMGSIGTATTARAHEPAIEPSTRTGTINTVNTTGLSGRTGTMASAVPTTKTSPTSPTSPPGGAPSIVPDSVHYPDEDFQSMHTAQTKGSTGDPFRSF